MVYILRFFLSLQNAVCFIILTYLVPVLFTFYIQGGLKLKKNNSGAKRLKWMFRAVCGVWESAGLLFWSRPIQAPEEFSTPHPGPVLASFGVVSKPLIAGKTWDTAVRGVVKSFADKDKITCELVYVYIIKHTYIHTGSAKKMYTHFNERKLYVV